VLARPPAEWPERRLVRPSKGRAIVERALETAGIAIDGPNAWDPRVLDDRFFDRVLREGTLGLGESYMDGWWDCVHIDDLIERMLRYRLKDHLAIDLRTRLSILRLRMLDQQSVRSSRRVAETHYDLGNDFFARMLGPTMTYSCGYWRAAASLDEAQDHKHQLICDKLGVERRHRLLDIGCGWGRLAAHAHRRTGCQVLGVNISETQLSYARQAHHGLPIRFLLADYRDRAIDAEGPFDRVVSVGMFEHVGRRNHRAFFARVADLLADDGLFLLQTIGNSGQTGVDPWVDRYIFPNSAVPCVRDLAEVLDEFFVLEDWHNFGSDYDRTLMEWARNFADCAREFPFDGRFYRMWWYYLHSFAGAFRARNNFQLWQVVVSKKGTRGGYRSIRDIAALEPRALEAPCDPRTTINAPDKRASPRT
jgi:cyclopropane-fatty-acyl-phospholipid synthase